LRSIIDQEFTPNDRATLTKRFQERAYKLSSSKHKQVKIMNILDHEWSKKGHGWVPLDKPDNIMRLIFEKWNSIKYWSEKKMRGDINVIKATRKRYNASVLTGIKHQTTFSKAEEDG
jgi:hypothetical protein